jgi:hypothetical protein
VRGEEFGHTAEAFLVASSMPSVFVLGNGGRNGGRHLFALWGGRMSTATKAKNCMRLYGCSYAEALAANDGFDLRFPRSFALAYSKQRHNAAARGVGWEITLPEWANVWRDSGHWLRRGKSAGSYCMARNGDVGPYKVGNVSIQRVETNSRAALDIARRSIDLRAGGRARRGTGRGWTFVARAPRRPYQVCIGSTYVGSFATQQEAEAAYAAAV